MNTKIKTFLMALVLLPATLIFAACGGPLDSKASVNVSGNYNQESSVEDLQTYVNAETTDTTSIEASYKISMDMKNLQRQKVTSSINAIVKYSGTKYEMYAKVSSKLGGETASMTLYMIGEQATTDEGIAFAGNVYADINLGTKSDGKYKFTIEQFEQMEGLSGMLEGFGGAEMFDFDNIGTDLTLSGDKAIMQSVTDNTKKFKVTLASGEDKTADLYYVFENDKWVGFQINNYTYTDDSMGGTITVNCAMCVCNDEINFDTNGYTEFTMPTA